MRLAAAWAALRRTLPRVVGGLREPPPPEIAWAPEPNVTERHAMITSLEKVGVLLVFCLLVLVESHEKRGAVLVLVETGEQEGGGGGRRRERHAPEKAVRGDEGGRVGHVQRGRQLHCL